MNPRHFMTIRLLLLGVLATSSIRPFASMSDGVTEPPQSVAAQSATGGQSSQVIRGIVLNAATNQPLARALVQVDGRSVLTARDGRFEFTGITEATTAVRVRKPGFYDGTDASPIATKLVSVKSDAEIELRLYPEVLITGTLNAANGEPLSQVSVQALRRTDDDSGTRWFLGGQTSSNSDGEFRLALPAGDYVVETQYSPERQGLRQAVLPTLVGGGSAGAKAGGGVVPMHLTSGTETRLDLRPPVRSSRAVHIRMDDEGGTRRGPQLQARTSNGMTFAINSRPAGGSDEVVAAMPRGTFTLISQEISEGVSRYGETVVTVADHDVEGVTLHITPILPLAVELAVDPSTTSDNQPPQLQQLGLSFYRADSVPSAMNQSVFLSQRRGESPGVALLPGRYRLHGQAGGQWFVESANLGGTDLLTQDLAVEAGSSPGLLRLVVSNQTGTLRGTARLAGVAATCWVYLAATAPSLSPVLTAVTGADGSFSRGFVPPGSYRALASETRLSVNLTDPAVQANFAKYLQTVSIAAGEASSVDLEAVPATEVKP